MVVTCKATPENVLIENEGVFITYGLQVTYEFESDTKKDIKFHDISPNKDEIEYLANKIMSLNLEVWNLSEVIRDFVEYGKIIF
jgi:hypothetical protein